MAPSPCRGCSQPHAEPECPRCGTPAGAGGSPSGACGNCGNPTDGGSCPRCGASASRPAPRPPAPAERPAPPPPPARREAAPPPPRPAEPGPADAGDIDIDLAAELPTPEPVGSSGGEAAEPRMSTGIEEVDRFFDGGLEPGTVAMVDGEPGAGKTTLLLQICSAFARRNPGATVLYVSGEQKTGTIDSVAARLELPPDPNFLRVTTNRWEHVEEIVERYDPALLVVDAIQVFRIARVGRPAGDVAQVRAVGVRIVTLAKGRSMSTFVVVHHNKAGGFAGPKVIEHLVDASASLDHVPGSDMRRLVQPKNRTADTSEVLLLQMTPRGLFSVPASSFIEERTDAPGSVVLAATAGTQTLFCLVQALVAGADEDEGGDRGDREKAPRRRVVTRNVLGLNPQRASVLCGVLGEHAPVSLANTQLYLQVAGGVEVADPAADLAVALAIGSSAMRRMVPTDVCAFGELGLGGEARSVARVAQRLRAAARQGIARAVVPGTRRVLEEARGVPIEVVPVRNVGELFGWLAGLPRLPRTLIEPEAG